MLCPNCGKETERGLCPDCFLKLNPVDLEEVEIDRCSCGRYFYQGKWKREINLEEVLRKNLISPRKLDVKGIKILSKEEGEGGISLEVEVESKYQGEEVKQKVNPTIKFNKRQCKECSKGPLYYEAILQFREFKPDFKINPELITGIKRRHGGFDFYINEKGYARKIARKFRKRGFQIKKSESLIGKTEDGKRKSRLTISIKPQEE